MGSISLPVASIGGLLSFIVTTFILFRILAQVIPGFCLVPKRRLPCKATFSPNDHAQICLGIFDVLSVLSFLVQAIYQYQHRMTISEVTISPFSAALLWIALTARQSCLVVILFISLLHIRLRRPISYGRTQAFLWAPSVALSAAGTGTAASLAAFELTSLFGGIASYISIVATLQTLMLISILRSTFRIIRRAERESDSFSWLEATRRKRRQSFDTGDIQFLKDRSSWVTSVEGSLRRSLSAWSFTTSQTNNTRGRHTPYYSLPSTLRSTTDSNGRDVIPIIPPVPPLPSAYQRSIPLDVPRNTSPTGSTNSWLTSYSGSRETMSSFSFPTTRSSPKQRRKAVILPTTSTTAVFPVTALVDSTSTSTLTSDSAPSPSSFSVSVTGIALSLGIIWIPYIFAIPYLILARAGLDQQLTAAGILLIVSICTPSILFLISFVFKAPLPLALEYPFPPKEVTRTRPTSSSSATLPIHTNPTHLRVRGKSGSYTVVEGRRSGDIWIEKRHAVDGLSRTERAISLLNPYPKLSVLPPRDEVVDLAPPLNEPSTNPRSMQGLTISDEDVDEIALVPWMGQTMTTESTPPFLRNEDSVTSLPMVLMAEKRPKVSARTIRLNSLPKDLPTPPPSIPLPPTPAEHDRSMDLSNSDIGDIPSEVDSESQYSGYASEYHESLDNHTDVQANQATPVPAFQELSAPDAHSTPHFKKSDKLHRLRSIPSLPSFSVRGSSASGLPPQTPYDTPDLPEILTVPGQNMDTSGQLNAPSRLSGSRALPSEAKSIISVSEGDKRSSLKHSSTSTRPLNLRSSGVTRQKTKSRRYTPLESANRARASRRRTHIPKDSKTLYMSRSKKPSSPTTPQEGSAPVVQATVPYRVEYMPAINRLSTILTDHAVRVVESNNEQQKPTLNILPEKTKPKRQHQLFKEKENTVKAHLSPLARTDSARARSRLIQGQKLPTVVVRPPSGYEFSETRLSNLNTFYNAQML